MVGSKIPWAVQWTREHFLRALDPEDYEDEDGGKKYLLIREEDVQQNGKVAFTRRELLSVRVLAQLIVLHVPQYQDREVTEVINALRDKIKGRNEWLDEALEYLLSFA